MDDGLIGKWTSLLFQLWRGRRDSDCPIKQLWEIKSLIHLRQCLKSFDSGQAITICLRSFGALCSSAGCSIHVSLKRKTAFLPNVTLRGPEIGASPQQCDTVDDERSHSQILNHHCGFLRSIRTEPTLTAGQQASTRHQMRAEPRSPRWPMDLSEFDFHIIRHLCQAHPRLRTFIRSKFR